MTDPKAEALARLKWQERNSEANMALMSARDIFRDGVFDGYDARDEEVAALKAEVERLRAQLAQREGEVERLRAALSGAIMLCNKTAVANTLAAERKRGLEAGGATVAATIARELGEGIQQIVSALANRPETP